MLAGAWRIRLRVSPRKADAEYFGVRLERLLQATVFGLPVDADELKWAAGLSDRLKAVLAKYEPLRRYVAPEAVGVAEALDAFERHIASKSGTERHRRETVARARATLEGIGAARISDITEDRVARWLAERRADSSRFGAVSSNLYLRSVKHLCRWLHKSGRYPTVLLSGLRPLPTAPDRRHPRRAEAVENIAKLLAATRRGPARSGTSAETRYWFYRLAVETGLRQGELRALRVVDLNCEKGHLVVPAAYSKRRRRDVVDWIRRETLDELVFFVLGCEPDQPLLRLCSPWQVSSVLRADLKAAGIPYRTNEGVFDFHAFRHTFCTEAGRRCDSLADLMHVCRLSNPALLARYTHASPEHIREAMQGMPTF